MVFWVAIAILSLDFLGSLAKLGVFSFEVVVGSNDSDHLYYFIGLFIYTTI